MLMTFTWFSIAFSIFHRSNRKKTIANSYQTKQKESMSTRTNAIAADFPFFAAWYDRAPRFDHLAVDKSYNCRTEFFRLRQFADGRYFLHQAYANAQDAYSSEKVWGAIEDALWCRRFKKLPMHERPAVYAEWYQKKSATAVQNDVWEYRDPPVDVTSGSDR